MKYIVSFFVACAFMAPAIAQESWSNPGIVFAFKTRCFSIGSMMPFQDCGGAETIIEARVDRVACKSPADKAGMKIDDVIVKVNAKTPESMTIDEFLEALAPVAQDKVTKITVRRKDITNQQSLRDLELRASAFDPLDYTCGKRGLDA